MNRKQLSSILLAAITVSGAASATESTPVTESRGWSEHQEQRRAAPSDNRVLYRQEMRQRMRSMSPEKRARYRRQNNIGRRDRQGYESRPGGGSMGGYGKGQWRR